MNKKLIFLGCFIAAAIIVCTPGFTVVAQSTSSIGNDSLPFNPIIRDKFTADPAAMVYKDTVYLYTGHDEAPKGEARYVMNE